MLRSLDIVKIMSSKHLHYYIHRIQFQIKWIQILRVSTLSLYRIKVRDTQNETIPQSQLCVRYVAQLERQQSFHPESRTVSNATLLRSAEVLMYPCTFVQPALFHNSLDITYHKDSYEKHHFHDMDLTPTLKPHRLPIMQSTERLEEQDYPHKGREDMQSGQCSLSVTLLEKRVEHPELIYMRLTEKRS